VRIVAVVVLVATLSPVSARDGTGGRIPPLRLRTADQQRFRTQLREQLSAIVTAWRAGI